MTWTVQGNGTRAKLQRLDGVSTEDTGEDLEAETVFMDLTLPHSYQEVSWNMQRLCLQILM